MAFFNCFCSSHWTKRGKARTVDEENFQEVDPRSVVSAASQSCEPLTGSFYFNTSSNRVMNHESPVSSVQKKSDSDSENRSNRAQAFDQKSDSEHEFWTSSRLLKRSCSDLTTATIQGLEEEANASPVSEKVILKKHSSAAQILPSKSRTLWRKLLLWIRTRRPQTASESVPDISSSLSRVDEWIKESCAALPQEESDDGPLRLEKGRRKESSQSNRKNSPAKNAEEDISNTIIIQQPLPFNSSSSVAHISGIGLKSIPKISLFSSLRAVNLSRNSIVNISPGSLPKGLHVLDLSKNKIHTVEGLRELIRLRVLNLSHNRISRIGPGLSSCTMIKELNLAGNKISVVDGMHRLLKLTVLDLSFNKITEAKALGQLVANYNSLLALNLSGNPLQNSLNYIQIQKIVTGLLPKIAILNKQPINSQKAREIREDANAKGALGNRIWISKQKKSGKRLLQSQKEKSSFVNAKRRNKSSKPKQR